MSAEPPFDPDWAIAPGATLAEWMSEHEQGAEQAAEACGIAPDRFRGMLTGVERISADDAARIAAGTGTSAAFWWARERRYRYDLARGKLDTTPGKEPE
jgi:HTH-type transcriptional regulator / antitoxin HigA